MTAVINGPTKPRLRGLLHATAIPVAVIGAIVLVVIAPTIDGKIASAIYGLTSISLFGVSGFYHRSGNGYASEWLRRWDHANIYLIIAGTYTPFGVLALTGGAQLAVLLIIWIGAAAGVAFRTVWLGAPRWLYTSLYIVLGWVAIFFIPQFLEGVGLAAVILVVAGGLLYSLGAVVYGLKRPDPWPEVFGFHEIFHAFTVAAYLCQFSSVVLVVLASAP
ncbi:PAQR family membrane homeostasis protein TrhA [Stackebrandtia nassauensis]|uniref:Hly-III family protein n=1 Tax=Stackebrandtia nassauensis (strain DSM 44728 / CIP 108903 / NRRL B-16338 / NBRC 102104 / LLR-40K-21) TaxID=446470 RepID=D3Q4J4_STANL|nr:hemolysin III family protein [Stackebrandtia nassauensis]ADD40154.1 Hly-III family protein [Stackebrandtia nassauensis DSM 44728]